MTSIKKTSGNEDDHGGDYIYLRTKAGQQEKFFWNDILYLEADGDYTLIVTTKCSIYKSCGITKQIVKLKHPSIYRCHRSYAINTNCVELFKHNYVVVGGKEILIAKKYRKELAQKLNLESEFKN